MADRPPFGFGPPGRPGDDDPQPPGGEGPSGPMGPFGFGAPGAGGPGGGGPNQFADALRQFADLLSYSGGPVNWELAKNLARHTIAAKGDPSVLANERAAVTEAIRLADLWLDDVTTFPSGIRKIEAWTQVGMAGGHLPRLVRALRADRGQGRRRDELNAGRRPFAARRGRP